MRLSSKCSSENRNLWRLRGIRRTIGWLSSLRRSSKLAKKGRGKASMSHLKGLKAWVQNPRLTSQLRKNNRSHSKVPTTSCTWNWNKSHRLRSKVEAEVPEIFLSKLIIPRSRKPCKCLILSKVNSEVLYFPISIWLRKATNRELLQGVCREWAWVKLSRILFFTRKHKTQTGTLRTLINLEGSARKSKKALRVREEKLATFLTNLYTRK